VIVRELDAILGTDRDVDAENWTSRRLLLRRDGMGFSMHDTVIRAGTETRMWYANHVEAVYCIEGEGEVEVLKTGEKFRVHPGMLYALDGHEEHILRARTQLRMICVFNPPLSGMEVHDSDGVYPLLEEPEKVAS
jgi:L-ectoine synthase